MVCQVMLEFAKDLRKVCAMPENNQALADAVTSRVREMGWSQTTVAARGGPSTTSLTKIASAQGSLSPKMLAQIDRGMDWTAGTAARILAGHAVADLDIAGISNDDLLAEVRRRMEGVSDAGQSAQKRTREPLTAAVVKNPRTARLPSRKPQG